VHQLRALLRAAEGKTHVHDVHATILHLLGLNHLRLTFRHNGRNERLTENAGEIIEQADLPMRFMAYTPCYRREAGSAGRDTRGMLRSHEFDKVEILALATADQAPALLKEMVGRAESTIAELELPYRIIEICTGDMGQTHHRSFDIEVYAPGAEQWLEVSSISWFSDYQARRANIRYRPVDADGRPQKGTQLVHTLNGSALAVPRVWAAIVENYRNADGSITVPTVLRAYMRGISKIA